MEGDDDGEREGEGLEGCRGGGGGQRRKGKELQKEV